MTLVIPSTVAPTARLCNVILTFWHLNVYFIRFPFFSPTPPRFSYLYLYLYLYKQNGEQEYYLPDQVSVANGILVIRSDNVLYDSVCTSDGVERRRKEWRGTEGRSERRGRRKEGREGRKAERGRGATRGSIDRERERGLLRVTNVLQNYSYRLIQMESGVHLSEAEEADLISNSTLPLWLPRCDYSIPDLALIITTNLLLLSSPFSDLLPCFGFDYSLMLIRY